MDAKAGIKDFAGLLRGRGIYLLLVVLLGLAAYSNSLDVPFHFDDFANIIDNPRVRDISAVPSFFVASKGLLASRPLTLSSFALNYHFGGFKTTGYHVVNLALHLANALMLYALVAITFGRLGGLWSSGRAQALAFFTAAVFVAHPIQTQAVTYIVSRSMLLAAFMYLAGGLLFIAACRGGRGGFIALAGLVAVSLLGMGTKENFVTFPVVLLMYDYVFVSWFKAGQVLRRAWIHVPVLMTLIYMYYLVSINNYNGDAGFGTAGVTAGAYFLTQLKVHWMYLRLLILPVGQNIDHHVAVASLTDSAVIASIAGYVLVLAAVVALWMRRSEAVFAIVAYFVILSPDSSIVPLKDFMFEHRLYLGSSVMFCLAGAIVIRGFEAFGSMPQAALKRAVMATAVLAMVLSLASYDRNMVWKSGISLWSDSVSKNFNNPRAHYNLGLYYYEEGQYDLAIGHLNMVLDHQPSHADTYNNLALCYQDKGHVALAVEHYEQALRFDPMHMHATVNLGITYMEIKAYAKARAIFERALRVNPGSLQARSYLDYLNKESL